MMCIEDGSYDKKVGVERDKGIVGRETQTEVQTGDQVHMIFTLYTLTVSEESISRKSVGRWPK
jgi:hypothetical protein